MLAACKDVDSQPKNDFEAFCKLKEKFSSFLSVDDISDIWKFVHGNTPSSSSTVSSRFHTACQHIEEMLGILPLSVSGVDGSPERDIDLQNDSQFHSFVLLCEELHHISILEEIWLSVDDTISDEDRFDAAVILAVERSTENFSIAESSDLTTVFSSLEVGDTGGSKIAKLNNSSASLPLFDGGKKQKRKEKRNKIMSSQQAVLDMLEDTFRGTEIPLNLIQDVAAKCHYDPEESIANIWSEKLRRHNLVRDGVSFASAATANAEETALGQNSSVRLHNPNTLLSINVSSQVSEAAASTNDSRFLSTAAMTARGQHESYHKFAHHFLSVAKRKNPDMRITLDRCLVLTFEGAIRPSSSSSNFHQEVRIDLHGLTVLRALELVETTLNYFYSLSPYSKSGKTSASKVYRITFVVGRGAHSAGGIAKLKPAVERYLMKNNENDWSTYEGEIEVCVKSRR